MTTSDPDDRRLFEDRIAAFESAWRSALRPKIKAFLPQSEPGDAAVRHELLLELIQVDLELRWQSGKRRGPLLTWYLKQFAELGSLDSLPLSLVAEEYRARKLWGDAPSHSEYVARFPRGGLALVDLLAGVDIAIEEEGGAAGTPIRRSVRPAPREVDPDAPLPYTDYYLKRQIGEGGMCKVYTAVQMSLDKPVAVKVLRKERLGDVRCVQRFRREARLTACLRHPGIVGVHGLGRLPDGGYFMVLDLIAGRDLSQAGAASPARAAQITIRLAEILAHVHRSGIIHADLKPGNVLADSIGNVYLTDFGLARRVGERVVESVFEEHPAGTAAFMAPEQIDARFGEIGPATDIYGLGGVLYALLAGRPPFVGSTVDEILAQVTASSEMAILLPELDPQFEALAKVCRRCLRQWPRDRYHTAQEVASALGS